MTDVVAADFAGIAEVVVGLDTAATGLPVRLASCCARYCRRLISKSASFRYSSSDEVSVVGACFSLGTSSLVDDSYCRATLRYWTTRSVCLLKVL